LEKSKKEMIENQIVALVRVVTSAAARKNRFDNITMVILNDADGLKMDYSLSEDRKSYILNKAVNLRRGMRMTEIRCVYCNKVLGRVPEGTEVEIEIKCPKCKTTHTYKLEAQEAQVS
jgi:phage FluMu protein Com